MHLILRQTFSCAFLLTLLFVGGAHLPLVAQVPQQWIASIDHDAESPNTDAFKIVVPSAERSVIWDVNDSLRVIPAYDLYCDWTTERIHPYKIDLTRKADTTVIPLIWTDTCDFHHTIHGHITSNFGPRRYRYHYGIDIKLYTGDPVRSVFDGVVRIARFDATYGKVVVVRHNNGLETLYAHLSKLNVKSGEWVEAGEIIGLGGNTGRSTGAHLHFETRYLGEPIDPNDIIDFETGTLKTDTLYLSAEHFEYLRAARAIKYHTVRRGDTLSAIASRYGTSITRLCQLNGIRTSTTLKIGQKLRYN
jgi:murein DD-endopeptidase MepM/ murein hydrolase activator NlpD